MLLDPDLTDLSSRAAEEVKEGELFQKKYVYENIIQRGWTVWQTKETNSEESAEEADPERERETSTTKTRVEE